MTLSGKQARFVQEYALDHNGSAAAVRAGYAPRSARVTASQFLTKPNVRGAVQVLERQTVERLQVSRDRVLDGLQTAIAMARMKADPHAMIAGWREIGRVCGYYAPERKKLDLSMSAQRTVGYLETLSDADLLAMADPGAKQSGD